MSGLPEQLVRFGVDALLVITCRCAACQRRTSTHTAVQIAAAQRQRKVGVDTGQSACALHVRKKRCSGCTHANYFPSGDACHANFATQYGACPSTRVLLRCWQRTLCCAHFVPCISAPPFQPCWSFCGSARQNCVHPLEAQKISSAVLLECPWLYSCEEFLRLFVYGCDVRIKDTARAVYCCLLLHSSDATFKR
eukprot:5669731-Pleurochrysis_carterae.AAC.3